jgi:hypothetical protein
MYLIYTTKLSNDGNINNYFAMFLFINLEMFIFKMYLKSVFLLVTHTPEDGICVLPA